MDALNRAAILEEKKEKGDVRVRRPSPRGGGWTGKVAQMGLRYEVMILKRHFATWGISPKIIFTAFLKKLILKGRM